MIEHRFARIVVVAVVLAAAATAGCTTSSSGTGSDGGYHGKGSRGGGWENFRAEAPLPLGSMT